MQFNLLGAPGAQENGTSSVVAAGNKMGDVASTMLMVSLYVKLFLAARSSLNVNLLCLCVNVCVGACVRVCDRVYVSCVLCMLCVCVCVRVFLLEGDGREGEVQKVKHGSHCKGCQCSRNWKPSTSQTASATTSRATTKYERQ